MNPQHNAPHSFRPLAWPAYFVAFLLCFFPLVEWFGAVGTPHGPMLRWRFAAVGMLSSMLLTPIVGLFLGHVTALVLRQRRAQWFMTGVSALTVIVLLALLGSFSLDALQLRSSVAPAVKRSFDIALVKVAIDLGLSVIGCLLLTVAGFRVARSTSAATRAFRTASSGAGEALLVGDRSSRV
jgi:chromate transport protein ChrA